MSTASLQLNLRSTQAMHVHPTPRLGGIAILLGFAVLAGTEYFEAAPPFLLITVLPVFLIGILEDLQVPMSPKRRLLAVWVGCVLQVLASGAWLTRYDIPYLDALTVHWLIGVPLTLLLVGGISHAFNLIDGLHGLSSATALTTCCAIATVAFGVGDSALGTVAGLFGCVIVGFLLVNFPFGKLFLGDAGAYSIGFILAWLGIALIERNPEISAWSVLLMFFWPIADTLWAILRRLAKGTRPTAADRMHMHHIVLRGVEIMLFGRHRRQVANPVSTVLMLPVVMVPALCGIWLSDEPAKGAVAVLLLFVGYVAIYLALLRLIRRRRRPAPVRTIVGAAE